MQTTPTNTTLTEPRYSVKLNDQWTPDMIGLEDSEGSAKSYAGIFGQPIRDFILGDGYKYAVRTKRGKWIERNKYDKTVDLGVNNYPITGIRIDTKGVRYAVHVKGGDWLPVAISGEPIITGVAIDGIWVETI